MTCLNDKVGNITSTVHSDDSSDKTAQMLIDLAKINIQRQNHAEVKISSDWIICLTEECGKDDDRGSGKLLDVPVFTLYIKNISCKRVSQMIKPRGLQQATNLVIIVGNLLKSL